MVGLVGQHGVIRFGGENIRLLKAALQLPLGEGFHFLRQEVFVGHPFFVGVFRLVVQSILEQYRPQGYLAHGLTLFSGTAEDRQDEAFLRRQFS